MMAKSIDLRVVTLRFIRMLLLFGMILDFKFYVGIAIVPKAVGASVLIN
jgi:ABC-type transport system involved in cytochrome bd biosynthesis fused ATPase/permease subunit